MSELDTVDPVKILIVDDDELTTVTICEYFNEYDDSIIPRVANDPLDVIDILRRDKEIKLLLCDYMMPKLNGLELLIRIKEEFPNMPFILMTGQGTRNLKREGLKRGAVRYLEKPLKLDELSTVIHEELNALDSGFRGMVESIQLADIIQLISISERSVTLNISRKKKDANVYFLNGEIVHAEYGELSGLDAINEILTWKRGNFTLDEAFTTPKRTITQSWQAILLDAARKMDETKAKEAGVEEFSPVTGSSFEGALDHFLKAWLQWAREILKGEAALPLKAIKALDIPDNLWEMFLAKAVLIVKDEIARIKSNPYFDFSANRNTQENIVDQLGNILVRRIVFTADSIKEIVESTLRDIYSQWQNEHLSIRHGAENPKYLAEELYKRASTVAQVSEGEMGLEIDTVVWACNVSGLELLGKAVRVEGELGRQWLSKEDFCNVVIRFLRIIDHYRIGRKLIQVTGSSETLGRISDIEKPEKVQEIDKPDPGLKKTVHDEKILIPDHEISQRPSKEKVAALVKDMANKQLYVEFMKEENYDYFAKTGIFSISDRFYDAVVKMICEQKSLKNALVVADNELYMLERQQYQIDVPAFHSSTKKFCDIIETYFTAN